MILVFFFLTCEQHELVRAYSMNFKLPILSHLTIDFIFERTKPKQIQRMINNTEKQYYNKKK